VEKRKLKSKKTYMLRSTSKQSGESSVNSDLEKKRKVTVGRICRKGRFEPWNERMKGDKAFVHSNNHKVKQ